MCMRSFNVSGPFEERTNVVRMCNERDEGSSESTSRVPIRKAGSEKMMTSHDVKYAVAMT